MKLSDNAIKATIAAEAYSKKLKDKITSADSLLYGLTTTGDMTSSVLEKYYITTDVMDEYLTDTKGPKDLYIIDYVYPCSENYNKVLTTAEDLAKKAGFETITTEIILLAILDLIDEIEEVEKIFVAHLVDQYEMIKDILDIIDTDKHKDLYTLSKEIKTIQLPGVDALSVKRRPVKYNKILTTYGVDLTKKAEEGKIDPLIGREKEVDRIVQILGRKTKNNPVLIGDPGVGKTSIVEGLALRLIKGNVPDQFTNTVIISLNMGSLLAGAKYRGEFEERIKKVLDSCDGIKDIVLFIDEIHMVIGAGNTGESSIDAANIMKPYLSDGRIQVIGATTIDEYRKIIEKDTALARRFQSVLIEEPTEDETLQIMEGLKPVYEKFHKIKITDEALTASVKLSVRYISDRFLPDKAIDVLDEAASMIKIRKNNIHNEADSSTVELINKYNSIYYEKEKAINDFDIVKALKARNKLVNLCNEMYKPDTDINYPILVEEDICKVISNWTKIPISKLNQNEKIKLLEMEKLMHESIIGQDEAITAIATAIRRNKSGLRDPKKPIASFLFLGSTGVGKTETVKALAKLHYGSEDNIIRLDMSEYMEKHTVAKLIGAPPGYVGHDDGGQLTNAVRTKPYSIVLFDEIEKAHADVFNILLQMLDDGRLTDSKGRTIDFKNTIIILTSNLGTDINKTREKTLGFGAKIEDNKKEYETDYKKLKENVIEACKKRFRPEFLNRIDETIVYHNLNEDNIRDIIGILTKDLKARLAQKNITLKLDESVMKYLIKQGTDLKFGARPLARAIQKYLMDGLSTELLSDNIVNGDDVEAYFDKENEKVLFKVLEKCK